MTMTKELERPLHRADEAPPMVSSTALHYLVLSRRIDEDNGLPTLELETTDAAAAQKLCKEMNAKDPTRRYKIETWTPMPRRRSD